MQQLTTVYRKYVNQMTSLSNPPSFKNVGDCSPNPLRIDAPACTIDKLHCATRDRGWPQSSFIMCRVLSASDAIISHRRSIAVVISEGQSAATLFIATAVSSDTDRSDPPQRARGRGACWLSVLKLAAGTCQADRYWTNVTDVTATTNQLVPAHRLYHPRSQHSALAKINRA